MSELLDQLAGKTEPTADVQEPQSVAPEEQATEEVPEENESGGYTINGQSFKTQAEAFKYAESLALEKVRVEAEANAYRQGVQEAAALRGEPQNVTQAPQEADKDFDEKYYADPKKYLQEFAEQIKAQTEEKILGQLNQKSEDEKLWSEFFRTHPDLENFREDCEVVLNRHVQDIRAISQTKGRKSAMDFLAQKTRAKFQAYLDAAKPRRELQSASVGATPGQTMNVTRKTSEPQELDFASQIRSLRNKTR